MTIGEFAPAAQVEDPAALHRRARELMALFDTEGYEQAVPLLREAIEQAPSFGPAYAALAETYAYWGFRREISGRESQSLYEMAVGYAEMALKLSPERCDSHRAMAVALRRGRAADPARREREARRAVELDPEDAEAWCEVWRVEGYDPDSPALRTALELGARLCGLHIDLGAVYCETEQLEKALIELVAALRLNPRNSLAHYDVAMVLDRKGLRPEAVRVLRKALLMHPAEPLLQGGLELLEERR